MENCYFAFCCNSCALYFENTPFQCVWPLLHVGARGEFGGGKFVRRNDQSVKCFDSASCEKFILALKIIYSFTRFCILLSRESFFESCHRYFALAGYNNCLLCNTKNAMDFDLISKKKTEKLKTFLRLRGLKVSGKKRNSLHEYL